MICSYLVSGYCWGGTLWDLNSLVTSFLSLYLLEEGFGLFALFFVFQVVSWCLFSLEICGNYWRTLIQPYLWEVTWFLHWKVNYQCWPYRKRKRSDQRSLWISWSLAMGAAQRGSIITSLTMLRNGEWQESWQSVSFVIRVWVVSASQHIVFLPFVNCIISEYERN